VFLFQNLDDVLDDAEAGGHPFQKRPPRDRPNRRRVRNQPLAFFDGLDKLFSRYARRGHPIPREALGFGLHLGECVRQAADQSRLD
jgi:hypothetical protein